MSIVTGKSALLIHNDEAFRKYIRVLLEKLSFEVREAENHAVAVSILQLRAFDLIISPSYLTAPCTDDWRVMAADAKFRGAKLIILSYQQDVSALALCRNANLPLHVLELPFSPAGLMSLVESVTCDERIPGSPAELKGIDQLSYVSVHISEFLTGSEASTDIYLCVSAGKFKKVAHGGSRIPKDQISRYAERGVTHLHIRKEHFARYVGFSLRIANLVRDNDDIEPERKVALAYHLTSNLIDQTRFEGIDKPRLQEAFSTVDTLITTLTNDTQMLDLMEMVSRDRTMSAHSLGVSVIASLIAREVGWDRPTTLFKVVVGSLFHDIGERELPQDVLKKRRLHLDSKDIQTLESHTSRGRDLLLSIRHMPEDIALIAAQHHEAINGTGYPHRLKKDQIHPLARLVSVADVFCDLLSGSKTDDPLSPKDAVAHMLRLHSLELDPLFLRALIKLTESAPTRSAHAVREYKL